MESTVIGESIVIEGEVIGETDLVIRGTVKGKVMVKDNLIIDRGGIVEADIQTQNVEVLGQVVGNISSSKVELKPQSRVIGDIKAGRILIAEGASFKGNVDME